MSLPANAAYSSEAMAVPCTSEAVEFKLGYLNTLKSLLGRCGDEESFVKAVNEAYPGLPGDVEALASALYK